MKAFVTGGTGFVGSHLVEALLQKGYDVHALVRKNESWLKDLPVTFVRGDMDDMDALQAGCLDADLIFHVAAVTRAQTWATFERANIQATMNLLDVAASVAPRLQKIVIVSSQAAVGPSGAQPSTENDPLQPVSQYGKSKKLMEEAVLADPRKLPWCIVRPPSVYGPREADIFTFIQTVNKGICPIAGDGKSQQLNMVYVQDLVEGILLAAENPNAIHQTYFLGGAHNYNWTEIRDAVSAALNKKTITIKIPLGFIRPLGAVVETVAGWFGQYPPLNREKATEAQHTWRLSIEKARKALGYQPQTSLADGMKETVAWYRNHQWL